MTSAGAVNVTRTLYRTQRNGPSYCPLEEQAGVISSLWTPRAARQAIHLTARINPYEVKAILSEIGGMQPSRSSIERLPKALNQHWEAKREKYERQLRQQEQIPKEAVTVSASLDGVLIPIKGSGGMGYSPYEEASCGTLSYYDERGQMLHTTYLSRMPERKKKTLKAQLALELKHALQQQPDLTVVKLADGARDNWSYLEEVLPKGYNVLDFFHAAEHLKQATDAIHGENSLKSSKVFRKWREILLEDDKGIEKLRQYLKRQYKKYPRRKVLAEQITYFNNNKL